MRSRTVVLALTVAASPLLVSSVASLVAQQRDARGTMHVYQPSDVQWKEGPASLPPGGQMAVLEGDPSKEGPFTMRLRLPDAYRIPPHFHGGVEHVTVISGTFNLGMGDTFDASATKAMQAGSFGYWPAGMRHYASTTGATVLQLHGLGPWTITYVNPSDDPRKK